MKRLSLLSVAALACGAPLWGTSIEVSSSISAVTVYNGMARVTRSFEAALPAGEKTVLCFAGMPERADGDNVQCSVTGGSALGFGMMSFDDEFTTDDYSPEYREIEKRLEQLQKKHNELMDELSRLKVRAGAMDKLLESIYDGIAEVGDRSICDVALRTMDASEEATAAYKARQYELDDELKDLSEQIADVRKELDEQEAQDKATCAEFSVEVVSQAGGVSRGEIVYYVPSRTYWTPAYVVRADTALNKLSVDYKASVYQNTGEDWDNVVLTLETSKPALGASPVEPAPVYLRQLRSSRSSSMAKSLYMEEAAAPMADNASAMTVAMDSNAVNVTSSMTGFRATLKDKVSVDGDGTVATLTILKREMDCELYSKTVPLVYESAFLMAKGKNAFPLPMLAGQMQVIVDGSTNGKGVVEETLPGEELELGLGVNQNIVVTRKTIEEKGRDSGFFGSSRIEERHYVSTVKNAMGIAHKVIVLDRIPISKDAKIEVKLLEPSGAEVDPETGIFESVLELKSGESAELVTKFRVGYPEDWNINGNF